MQLYPLWRQRISPTFVGLPLKMEIQLLSVSFMDLLLILPRSLTKQKEILCETQAMLSKLAKIDFYPLMGMFSNPTIRRDLPTFHSLIFFFFSKATNLALENIVWVSP